MMSAGDLTLSATVRMMLRGRPDGVGERPDAVIGDLTVSVERPDAVDWRPYYVICRPDDVKWRPDDVRWRPDDVKTVPEAVFVFKSAFGKQKTGFGPEAPGCGWPDGVPSTEASGPLRMTPKLTRLQPALGACFGSLRDDMLE
jgi:hypothetical protein